MPNINWEKNRLKILIFIAVFLSIILYFSSSNDDFKSQEIKVVQPKIEKEITVKKSVESKKEKIIIKEEFKSKIKKIEVTKDDIIERENISSPQEIKKEILHDI